MPDIKKVFISRELRKQQTLAEKHAWQVLRGRKCLGLKFKRQQVIGDYIADFYCPEKKLVIELDGGIHKHRKDYDEMRDMTINSKSIKVIRINNKKVFQESDLLMFFERLISELD